jgi:hypothetical protein
MREYARYVGPGWEMEQGSERAHGSNPLGWLLLGIGIGASVALLLTPSTGRELRSALAFRLPSDHRWRGSRHAAIP